MQPFWRPSAWADALCAFQPETRARAVQDTLAAGILFVSLSSGFTGFARLIWPGAVHALSRMGGQNFTFVVDGYKCVAFFAASCLLGPLACILGPRLYLTYIRADNIRNKCREGALLQSCTKDAFSAAAVLKHVLQTSAAGSQQQTAAAV